MKEDLCIMRLKMTIKNEFYNSFKANLFLSIACSSCTMPTAWLGSWYQSGMNSLLEITIDHIQTKGLCLDVLPIQHYYLFTDRYVDIISIMQVHYIRYKRMNTA